MWSQGFGLVGDHGCRLGSWGECRFRKHAGDFEGRMLYGKERAIMQKRKLLEDVLVGRASALYVHLASLRRAISRKDLMSVTSPGMAAVSCHLREV